MTLTIEIPDEIANRVLSLPDLEREELAVYAVVNAWQTAANELDEAWELTDEDIAAINEGIDDAEAGRFITSEEFHKRIYSNGNDAESVLDAARARVKALEADRQMHVPEVA